jgi:glycosyltransferase involved in cell wall biosynthesis
VRILVSSQHFWPEVFRINDLVKALTQRGADVDVLTGKPNYPEGRYYPGYRGLGCQQERYGGGNIFRVPLTARGSGGAVRLVFNYLSFIVSGLLFAPWLLRGRRYDVIFVYASSPLLQAIPALFLGWIKRCPVVVWVQDLWPESLAATGYVKNRYILAGVRRIVHFIYSHSELLLVQSRAYLPAVSKSAPGKPVIYYPNSVESVFCDPVVAEAPSVPGLDANFPIVFAGNIGTVQAIDLIVEAADLLKAYPDIHFVLLGEGVRGEWLRHEVEVRGMRNVSVPGRYPVEAMPGIYRKAAALLVALTGEPVFAATVPSKLQTYLAAGRPILASLDGEGARIVTEADAGLAAPAGDARALADNALALYKMKPGDRDRLGSNGCRYFQQHFDRSLLVDRLLDHFRSVAPKRVTT